MSSETMATEVSDDRIRCDYGRCLVRQTSEKTQFFAAGYTNMIHPSSYKFLYLNTHDLTHFSKTYNNAVACGKLAP